MAGVIIFPNALWSFWARLWQARFVPTNLLGLVLSGLHDTIGITMPPPDKLRMYALIWLASVIVIVDGAVFLLVFLASARLVEFVRA